MTTFCTNTRTDILNYGKDIPTVLYDTLQKLGPASTISDSFYKVFAVDMDGSTAQQQSDNILTYACGLGTDINIYEFNKPTYSFTLPGTITINITDIRNFWASSSNAENFGTKLSNVFSDLDNGAAGKPSGEDVFKDVYTQVNILLSIIFYNFYCVSTGSDIITPSLGADNPFAVSVDNFRKFFTIIRGAGSKMVCNLCMSDYFLPKVENNEDKAGAIVRKNMAGDTILRKWCGCCIPQEKDKPSKGYNFLNPFSQDGINYPLYCEPLCNSPVPDLGSVPFSNNNYTIPLIRGDSTVVNAPINNPVTNLSYTVPRCDATVCVIDTVNIDVVASRGTTVNFSQVCPGCNDDNPCICYSYGKGVYDKIQAGSGGMQNPIIFKQNCPNAFCYDEQADGSFQEVKCNSVSPANTGKGKVSNYEGGGVFTDLKEADIYGVDTWLFPISLLIIMIIFFLGSIFTTLYRNRVEPTRKQDNDKEKKKPFVL